MSRKRDNDSFRLDLPRIGHIRSVQWSEVDDGSQWYKRYGITSATRTRMIEAQNGACAICHEKKPLYVDHCHDTGRVRGMLCCSCNTGLGALGDRVAKVERAAAYLSESARFGADVSLRGAWEKRSKASAREARMVRSVAPKAIVPASPTPKAAERRRQSNVVLDNWPEDLVRTFPTRDVERRSEFGQTRWAAWCPMSPVAFTESDERLIATSYDYRADFVHGVTVCKTGHILAFGELSPIESIAFYTVAVVRSVEKDFDRYSSGEDWRKILCAVVKDCAKLLPTGGAALWQWHHSASIVIPVCPALNESLGTIDSPEDLVALAARCWRETLESWQLLRVVKPERRVA